VAVLSDPDRQEVTAKYMTDNAEEFTLTKVDIRAAVNAFDDYFNANAAAINQALPQPARAALSQSQKAHLLTLVIAQRYFKGS
jgi:hypothetical protein